MKTLTGANDRTILCSEGIWKGQKICVDHQECECPMEGHELQVMHCYGDKGEHYCPTGYLMCGLCGGIADEPEPYECHLGPNDPERW